MKLTFLIILNKLITFGARLLGRNASVLPGSFVVKFDLDVLNKVKWPKYVIGVTGSSGKGSTCKLINHILTTAGYNVAFNKDGSNAIRGLITTVLNDCNLKGEVKSDIVLLELDEKHIKLAFKESKLTHLVVTNITRDQPARNAEGEIIFKEIFKTINEKTTLIINGDDPLVSKIKLDFKGNIITYGLDENKYSYKDDELHAIDNAYCPKCHKKLVYDYYHYGHIGNYHCNNCDFKRGTLNYEVKDVDLKKQIIRVNNEELKLNKDILFAVYYTVAAYAVCKEIGIKDETLKLAINEKQVGTKGLNVLKYKSRSVNMLESKNENALSYLQSINYLLEKDGKKTIILGFNSVSRRYQYNDLSWLWDVKFELLRDKSIDKIICLGKYKYDVATRLSYAGIDDNTLVLLDDITKLFEVLDNTQGDIYTLVCFDMTSEITKMVKEYNHEN